MRVLHLITPRHLGGAELLVMRVMQEQAKMGVVSRLITRQHAHVEKQAKQMGLDVVTASIGGKLNPGAVRAAQQKIQDFQPDLVCTHLSSATLWGSLAARLSSVPCVAFVHGFNSAFSYRFADMLICVSEAVGKHMRDQRVPTSKLRVVHNGIDLEPFLNCEPAVLPIPSNAFVVGAVAHLSPKKGYGELIHVARRVKDTHFVIVGEGPMRAHLEQEAAGRLRDRLHLLGFRQDIPALMRRFDLFCLPSWKEPFGLVLLEAMAASKPVVAFRSGGVEEIVQHNQTGLLAPFPDIETMAAHISQLRDDPALCQSMGAAGLERVSSCFTLAHTCTGLLHVFNEVVSR